VKLKFVSNDGVPFDTSEECKDHEWNLVLKRATKLKPEDIDAALHLRNMELNDALEKLGRACGNARREAGIFRFRHKTTLDRLANQDAEDRDKELQHQHEIEKGEAP
jgi:hypothetical protein